jgi:tetratricopeptide (TPR) repeat protein
MQDPAKLVYYVRLGGVYMLRNLYGRALEVFKTAAERFPDVAEAHYFVAIAARGLAAYDVSEAALRRSLALRPDNADALAQLGFILTEVGRYKEAEETLRRAVSLSGKHFYAHYDLGRLLVKTRRYQEAIPVLERGAEIKAGNPGVHYQLFMAFSRLKLKEESDRELALFKKLEEESKKRRRDEDEIQNVEADVANPAEPPARENPQPKIP